ncbi:MULTISPECIES: ABC transporter permease [unclassified Enterococcus]|uniref:ABC transporter permease n=1 Tax=unclassified Enterococcus TaxID=2608891 RepID=UPI001554DCEA|nr:MULTISPECIES: ABC transporter permease [unclassified Enterococcus]MBS7578074.1 ABC transporter permease [Enterococcus sp. MMGLQ5-2]MBS7585334.1 ABC transporter permease [Enterococcus sp. MMGLQ5-1]NPD13191.1 ABC transporter permease [Enterococcus sp. MMGLQ5-1]NPD37905.1 ABC transporter permease [Enterococcus sp. MMGLQ5-2]
MKGISRIKNTILASPIYLLSVIFLTLLFILTLAAPLIPIDPNATDVSNMSQAPSWEHLFGTDEIGRDYFIRVLYGGRVSLLVGILAMITATTIGTLVGLIAGYFGGIIDSLLMRLVDVLSSIPWLVLVIVLSVFLKPGLTTIIIVIGGFSWMRIARLIRGETLSAKEREYVVYSQFLGESWISILSKHILPSALPTLIVAASSSISSAIMTESALSFLGMGIQQPMASWGSLLQNAQSSLQRAPYMAILPGLFVVLTIYSFNNIGDMIKSIIQREET